MDWKVKLLLPPLVRSFKEMLWLHQINNDFDLTECANNRSTTIQPSKLKNILEHLWNRSWHECLTSLREQHKHK